MTKKPAKKKPATPRLVAEPPQQYFPLLPSIEHRGLLKTAPKAATVVAKCEHRSLVFIDGARRLACCEDACGRTWILESKPGSHIADVGLMRFGPITDGSPRVQPGSPAKALPAAKKNPKK